jgi:hypothetical protein
MAHYAFLDENNIVTQVITGIDENQTQIDVDGTVVGGSSEAWEEFYLSRPWIDAVSCKRTSYNKNIRKNFANIGFIYDEVRDAFIPPKPFNSWILNEDTCLWESPIPYPFIDLENPKYYIWNEDMLDWEEVQF